MGGKKRDKKEKERSKFYYYYFGSIGEKMYKRGALDICTVKPINNFASRN